MAASSTASAERPVSRPLKLGTKTNVEGWMFVLPVVIGTIIFDLIPMFPSLYWSLTFFDAMNPPKFIGLRNFAEILENSSGFVNSLRVTLLYTFGQMPVSAVFGFILALLVNRKLRGIVFFRAAYYLPVISSIVAVAAVWKFMFSARFGIINFVLGLVGIDGPSWLNDGGWALVAIIIVGIWSNMGYDMVLFLAGLQGIPDTLYEAADIDGASAFQKMRNITVPLLTPTIFFIFIMGFIGSFRVFALVRMMTDGGPGTATEAYVFFLYEEAFRRYQYGKGSAMAMVGFGILGLITLFQWRMSKRWVYYG